MPPEPTTARLPTRQDAPKGRTIREVARLLRVGTDRVRGWIRSGELEAINTAATRCGKPRYVVLPSHLAEFEKRRRVQPPPKPAPRRKRTTKIDYYPD
jgi:excisionase family DNA binding protein